MPNPNVASLVAAAQSQPPRCGSTRLILIDGPAGAGKTTLANRLALALGGAASAGAGTFDPANLLPADAPVQILHGDDMYEGWDGLAGLDELLLGEVLEPLSRGEQAGFRMWDWVENRRSHRIDVPPRPYLIVEGVGVAQTAARALASLVVFVEAPWEVRLQRGVDRDHMAYDDVVERWNVFEAEQNAFLDRHDTRAAADVILDGTSPVLE